MAQRPDPPVRLPGAHRVVARLAGGRVAIYWYRRRGEKPALATFTGETMAAALQAERDGADELVSAYGQRRALPAPTTVRDLVTLYKAAADGWGRVGASTRATWSPWLDAIVDEFGDLPAVAVPAKGVRRDILEWRDRFAATPRKADTAIQVINRLFNWAVDRELIEKNPAAGIEQLWRANRAEIIVTPDELAAICAAATPAGALAFRLAAVTGMRRGDLIDLRWGEVSDFYIDRPANKSTTGRRLLVPLTAEARALVAELREINRTRRTPSTFVLNSSKGRWSKGGLGKTWDRAVNLALGLEADRHFHDLRGTAVTGFCQAGLTDEEIADIMAWEPAQVRAIRKRYVDRNKIVASIIRRIERSEG